MEHMGCAANAQALFCQGDDLLVDAGAVGLAGVFVNKLFTTSFATVPLFVLFGETNFYMVLRFAH